MKDKILHNATEMFLNLGFKSVTMDDIAKNSGVSKKTSLLRRLQSQTLPDATPLKAKVHPLNKMAITCETLV